jgi:CRP/FNR family transcriptional regulator, polysaccharide utilization system transcription regulator
MKKILLIEDNPDVRENTAEILELAEYQVATAENGRIGVDKAREIKPDLIICDIMMPELDGYGVLYTLSKNPETAIIPFIFLSAKADRADVRRGMTLGADDYITKPFDDMELLQAVESRLKKNELLQREYDRSKKGYDDFINEVKGFEDLEKLSQESTIRHYKKRDIVFEEGQYPRYLYLVQSGKVKIYRSNEEGKEYISNINKTGDYFGYQPLLEEKTYSESAEALEDSDLVLIPKDDFLRLVHSNRQVALRFIRMLSNNLSETEEKLLHMAYNSVRKRVAQALILLKDKYHPGGEDKPTFAFSREDLANIAGTSTESGIRALSDFKDEGLVDLKGSTITLLNVPKLERMRN